MNARKAKALRRDVKRAAIKHGDDVNVTRYVELPVKRIVFQEKDKDGNITSREELRTERRATGWKQAYKFLKKVYRKLNKIERRGV